MIKVGKRGNQKNRDIFIGLGLTLLLILIAEFCARSFFYAESFFKLQCQACKELGQRDYASYSAGYGDLMPNQNGIWTIWSHRPYHVQTNSVGLRNVEPLKENTNLRVLAIGDSFTFGPYVTNEDTWPGWLEVILRKRLQHSDVEVLNAGIAGYTIEDEFSYFQDKGQPLAPNLVILQFFTNDISDLRPEKRQIFRRDDLALESADNQAYAFFKQLALYRLAGLLKSQIQINRVQGQINSETGEQVNADTPNTTQQGLPRDSLYYTDPKRSVYQLYYQQYETELRNFIHQVEAAGSQLVIVAFPEYTQIPLEGYPDGPQQFIEAIANETNTPFLNLIPAFRSAGEIEDLYLLSFKADIEPDISDPFFPDYNRYVGNGHLSRYGYRVAARTIADFLLTKKIIKSNLQ